MTVITRTGCSQTRPKPAQQDNIKEFILLELQRRRMRKQLRDANNKSSHICFPSSSEWQNGAQQYAKNEILMEKNET